MSKYSISRRIANFLKPRVSAEFREATHALTQRKVLLACKITILLWILTTPLEIVLVPDKKYFFFAIRFFVILGSVLLIVIARRSAPRRSYAIVVVLFSMITLGFIGFSYLFQEGLEVINQAFLSFVFLLGLSVVWPPLYTLALGTAIVTGALAFQYLTAGASQKLFVDTVYLYSAAAVAVILTQLNYRLEEGNFQTEERLEQIKTQQVVNEEMREELRKLNNFSQLINNQSDLVGVLKFMLAYFKREFGIDIVWLLGVTQDKNRIDSMHLVTAEDAMLSQDARVMMEKFSIPLETVSSFSITEKLGLPHYVRRIADKLDNPVDLEMAAKTNLHGFLQVPIRIEGKVVAILDFRQSGTAPDISALDVARIGRFCEQVGGAVHTSALLTRLRDFNSRIENDLEVARKTQLSLIPKSMPRFEGLNIRARYRAMEKLGGDFYDFQEGHDKLGVLIADVSGHGVPAALIVSTVNLAFSYHKKDPPQPDELLSAMNESLWANIGNEFVTAANVLFDAKTRKLRIACAGHPPVLVWKSRARRLERMRPSGKVLGLLPKVEFAREEIQLDAGDRVLLYTDGAYEALNSKDEIFGMDRLENFLMDNVALSPDEFLDRLMEAVLGWCDLPEGIDDDVALVVIDGV